jgi:hypothetical protein
MIKSFVKRSQKIQNSNPFRRFELKVAYPNFDDNGRPYFDQTYITETLSMTLEELQQYQWQEQQGYLKILSTRTLIPSK